MVAISHLSCTFALVWSGTQRIELAAVSACGATLPDLLEKFLPGVEHRTVTHWLFLWIILVGLGFLVGPLPGAFLLGGLLHCLQDALSEQGVPLGPIGPAVAGKTYRTGTWSETVVVALWLVACLLPLRVAA